VDVSVNHVDIFRYINFRLYTLKLLLLLLLLLLLSLALKSSPGYGLLVSGGFLITHNSAVQFVGLLWTSDQLLWGPEGSGRLRLPDSVTSAFEGDISATRTGRLYPQEYSGIHFKRLTRPWSHGLVGCHGKNPPLTPLGIDPGTFRLVALTITPPQADWQIDTHNRMKIVLLMKR
jgi:hypothetical protein